MTPIPQKGTEKLVVVSQKVPGKNIRPNEGVSLNKVTRQPAATTVVVKTVVEKPKA